MTFTKTPPTTPGFYAHRYTPDGELALFVLSTEDLKNKRGPTVGEWCRLVPAEEVEKAHYEGWQDRDYRTGLKSTYSAWYNGSRAKQVAEGKL